MAIPIPNLVNQTTAASGATGGGITVGGLNVGAGAGSSALPLLAAIALFAFVMLKRK